MTTNYMRILVLSLTGYILLCSFMPGVKNVLNKKNEITEQILYPDISDTSTYFIKLFSSPGARFYHQAYFKRSQLVYKLDYNCFYMPTEEKPYILSAGTSGEEFYSNGHVEQQRNFYDNKFVFSDQRLNYTPNDFFALTHYMNGHLRSLKTENYKIENDSLSTFYWQGTVVDKDDTTEVFDPASKKTKWVITCCTEKKTGWWKKFNIAGKLIDSLYQK